MTKEYAEDIEEEDKARDFMRECHRGAGTARYDSTSWRSALSSRVGGSGSEVGICWEDERKVRRGVKS